MSLDNLNTLNFVANAYFIHPNTLRKYIKKGLIKPVLMRDSGKVKRYLFGAEQICKLEKILKERDLL